LKTLQINLFGRFEVFTDGVPMRRLRTHRGNHLLALMALRLGRPIDRSFLAATIWPDSDHSDALYSLRRTLTDLRQALGSAGSAILSPSTSSVQLDVTQTEVDLAEFEAAIKLGDEASVARAAELFRGPLLEEWRFDWLEIERSVRERELVEALIKLSDAAEQRGDSQIASNLLRNLSILEPHDEAVFRRLMSNLVRSGNSASAQKAYDDFRKRLLRNLDIHPSEQTQELARTLLASPVKSTDSSRFVGGNLPSPTNALIGRRSELVEAVGQLCQRNLVTLIGPGGVGKTRLAFDIAREASEKLQLPAIAVDLLAVRDADHLLDGLAAAARSVDPDPAASPVGVVGRLTNTKALVLLDNCEHLIEPVKRLVKDLLEGGGIKVLATSQLRLDLPREAVIRISPLPVPSFDDLSLDEARSNDAVRLLAQCIAKAKGSFDLDDRNIRAVCRICRILEGVPLALELAATRTRLLTLDQVANLLEDRFKLLRTTERSIEERHRTLQATMDWSYGLLSDPERELLQTASVFAGYWTAESVTKVHEKLDAYEALDVLERLVDRSLVVADAGSEQPRFRLLDSVRQFAAEKLAERGERTSAKDRHLRWFTELAEMAEPHYPGAQQREWKDRIASEYENIPAAFAWAKTSLERTEYALRIAGTLLRYWWNRGELPLGRETVARVLEYPGATSFPVPYARVIYVQGALAWSQGDNLEAVELQHKALAIFNEHGETARAAGALRNLCQSSRNLGRSEDARRYGTQALELYQSVGNTTMAAYVLTDLAIAALDESRLDQCSAYFEQAAEYARAENLEPLEALALMNWAGVMVHQKNYAPAEKAYMRAEVIYERLENRILLTMTRNNMASMKAERGDIAGAKALVPPMFETFTELGEKRGLMICLETSSTIAMLAKEYSLSALLLGRVDFLREDLNIPRAGPGVGEHDEQVQTLVANLGEAEYRSLSDEGRATETKEMIRVACEWLENPS